MPHSAAFLTLVQLKNKHFQNSFMQADKHEIFNCGGSLLYDEWMNISGVGA
jgi:hypothetical protein